MSNFNEHFLVRSRHGNLDVKITTNETHVRFYAKTDTQKVDRSFALDDPELQSKVGSLWNIIKTELDNQVASYLSSIEQAWIDFNSTS